MSKFEIECVYNGYILRFEGKTYVYPATHEFKLLEDLGKEITRNKVKVEFR